MPGAVKSLKVTYNDVSERNVFTNGDTVTGQVVLEVTKDCGLERETRPNYCHLPVKGQVFQHQTLLYSRRKRHWYDDQSQLTNRHGETYSNLLAAGSHIFPFTFQFPLQEMPSSFKGSVGKIVYLLETRLSRSMRIRSKDTIKIPFVTQAVPTMLEEILTPQHESKDKKMRFFNSGTVAMDVNIEKSGFFQGEGINVLASIQNNSTREIKPKYCIYRKHSFFASGKRKLDTKDLLKEVGEPIPPSASQTVKRVITVPHDLEPSILNCKILKAEYRLRVYLDVKFASDPAIKFPITILPAAQASAVAASAPSTAAGFGFGSFGYQNPPARDTFNPPPPYEFYSMYPSLK
ncbi:arrestin domain-containing protein 3-like [Hippocampus comes]|uniref:arrestin domain-containing protein 3-like n=1 Tax=Hippocampus comes TaxID=109280 RepID=UPI00094F0063|nr:PREDICTED: arrestin domain-containing protein 3-like [Hippocampus comes]